MRNLKDKKGEKLKKILKFFVKVEELKLQNEIIKKHKEEKSLIEIRNNLKKLQNVCFDIMNTTLIITYCICLLNEINEEIEIKKELNSFNLSNVDIKSKNISKILDTIIYNPNLTVTETNYLLNIQPILEENFEYLHIEDIVKKLKNLDIRYENNIIDEIEALEDKTICGTFGLRTNKNYEIYIYQKFNLDSCCFNHSSDSVLFHEINHALEKIKTSNIEYYKYEKGGSLVSELLTEIYTREYGDAFLSEKSQGYEIYMPLIYMLCELFEIEDLREYRFSTDPTNIKNKLLELDNDEAKAELFMNTINTCDVHIKNLSNVNSLEEGYFTLAITKEHFQSLYNQYKYYYELKYNHKLIENKNVMYSIYSTIFETSEVRKLVANDLYLNYGISNYIDEEKTYFHNYQYKINDNLELESTNIGSLYKCEVQPKGYFSTQYSNKHQYVQLYIDENMVLYSSGITKKIEDVDQNELIHFQINIDNDKQLTLKK